jgi:hypothetical protein
MTEAQANAEILTEAHRIVATARRPSDPTPA